MDKVLDYLQKEIEPKTSVVVALSGGPDSMCLVSLLLRLKETLDLNIIIAHVNHKVRKESEEEELFVKKYAEDHNLKVEIKHLDEYVNNKFKESEGHDKRYNFFDQIMAKYQAKYLLTAHHGDDLMETILMRLNRGSNLKGYIGFREKQIKNNYIILRPLLIVTKADILKYNDDNNIKYVIDKSNESKLYTRNRYRLDILPFLKKENKLVHLKYKSFSEELINYYEFVQNYIKENEFIVDNYIVVNKIKNESLFIKKVTVETLIRKIQDEDKLEVNNQVLDDVINLLDKKGNKKINLNNNYVANKEYDKLLIEKNNNIKKSFKYIFNDIVETDKWLIKKENKWVDNSNFSICLSSNEIVLPLVIRSRNEGDTMLVKNLNGHKKIKDIFINEKVPNNVRDSYPIVCDSENKILWVPGIKKSQFAKDKDEKYDIIIRYEVKE